MALAYGILASAQGWGAAERFSLALNCTSNTGAMTHGAGEFRRIVRGSWPAASHPAKADHNAQPKASLMEPVSSTPPLRVLLVEDNAVNMMVAQAFLAQSHHIVTAAEDGQEAVQAFTEGQFDVVLMDCMMPVLDGFDATRQIRAWEQANGRERTPIIALTANALSDDLAQCLAAGMDAHLSKPYQLEALNACLRRWAQKTAPAAAAQMPG